MNYVLFGTVWGRKQTAQSSVLADRDWYFASNTLFVFSNGNPAASYGNVAACCLASGQMIYLNGNSYVNLQHFKLTYFDSYGSAHSGAAHDITVGNVWAEGIIPNATLPQGFYVSSSVSGANINLYNVDSHRNTTGFRWLRRSGVGEELPGDTPTALPTDGQYDEHGVLNLSLFWKYAGRTSVAGSGRGDDFGRDGGTDGGATFR